MHTFLKKIQDKNVLDIKIQQKKKDYNLSNAQQIDEVAAFSIAQQIGLEKDDYLISICGNPAINKSLRRWSLTDSVQIHEYLFYQPRKKQELVIRTNGIPLGIDVSDTSEAIGKQYIYNTNYSNLALLWERYEWDILEHIFIDLFKRNNRSIFTKILHFDFKSYELSDIENLFLGVNFYEQGDRETGLSIINDFYQNNAQHWTMNFTAIVFFYHAKELIVKQQREEALNLLMTAYQYSELPPIENEIKKLGGKIEQQTAYWQGKKFPVDYTLPIVQSKNMISLSNTLDNLAENELHIICLLGGYRCNGPYESFIFNYILFNKYFSDILYSLHVITTKNHHQGDWLDGEYTATERGLNIRVLHDQNDRISEAINQQNSPFILVLNKQGKIVYQDGLSSQTQLWDLLYLVNT